MRFKLKRLRILTGGPQVAMLSKSDAQKFNIHDGDRISITLFDKKGRKLKSRIVIVDISSSKMVVPFN